MSESRPKRQAALAAINRVNNCYNDGDFSDSDEESKNSARKTKEKFVELAALSSTSGEPDAKRKKLPFDVDTEFNPIEISSSSEDEAASPETENVNKPAVTILKIPEVPRHNIVSTARLLPKPSPPANVISLNPTYRPYSVSQPQWALTAPRTYGAQPQGNQIALLPKPQPIIDVEVTTIAVTDTPVSNSTDDEKVVITFSARVKEVSVQDEVETTLDMECEEFIENSDDEDNDCSVDSKADKDVEREPGPVHARGESSDTDSLIMECETIEEAEFGGASTENLSDCQVKDFKEKLILHDKYEARIAEFKAKGYKITEDEVEITEEEAVEIEKTPAKPNIQPRPVQQAFIISTSGTNTTNTFATAVQSQMAINTSAMVPGSYIILRPPALANSQVRTIVLPKNVGTNGPFYLRLPVTQGQQLTNAVARNNITIRQAAPSTFSARGPSVTTIRPQGPIANVNQIQSYTRGSPITRPFNTNFGRPVTSLLQKVETLALIKGNPSLNITGQESVYKALLSVKPLPSSWPATVDGLIADLVKLGKWTKSVNLNFTLLRYVDAELVKDKFKDLPVTWMLRKKLTSRPDCAQCREKMKTVVCLKDKSGKKEFWQWKCASQRCRSV